ncbi:MAG TPA: hypothetical protein VES20_10400, partial [Bryobacteraceae bacterium]|nr:hypothetical protein [Bryobacteraceae bacterium]
LRMLGAEAVAGNSAALGKLLTDDAPAPRIAAAEALGLYGTAKESATALSTLVELSSPAKHGSAVSVLAMNALSALGAKAKPAIKAIRDLDMKDTESPERLREYPARLHQTLVESLS